MSHFRSPRRVFVAALAGSLAIGLSCEQLDVTAVDVDSVTITPDPTSVEIGKTVQLEAVLEDAAGNRLTRPLQWSSETPSVATVDGNGRVTGVTAGTARIVAASGGRSGDAMVTVTQNTVETVDVTPETAALAPGETQQLTAVARDADGLAIPGRTASWLSESPGVATVNASGVVTAVSVGTATIRATIDGVVGTALIAVQQKAVASVTVTPPNASVLRNNTVQLTAVARAADNSILLGRTITWISDAPAIASVNGNGLVTGVAIGTATIRAVIDGVTGSATIQVESRPVASVTVQPAASAVIEGNTVQLTAELKAQDGTVLTGRTVTWSSSAAAIATVNGNGLVTGVQVGQATITATAEGVSGTAVVNVQAKPVQTVTVTPTSVSLMVGDTVRIAAELRAADGSLITNRKPVWSSSDDAIATVDTDGLVTAVARGNVTITATAEGKQGTSSVSVTDPVATVTLAPDSAKLIQGDTLTFVATTRASDGTVITGRVIAWSSLNPAVASIDPATGKVTAVAVGTTQIVAMVEGKADSAKVTVDPKPVTSVTIQPANPSVILGGTLQLTGELKAADGTVLSGRPVQWTSTDQTVATVTNTGLVSGLKVGSTTIRLTSTNEGVFGEVVLQVVDQPVASVVVTPPTANMFVGDTLRLNALTLAADGVTDLQRSVTWSIEAITGDASISASGLVEALAPGTVRAIATAEQKADTSIITISLKPVNVVTVSPKPVNIIEGQTQAVSAALQASDGTPLTRQVTWTSRNSGVATVTSSGLTTANVQGVLAGSAYVVAEAEGKSDSTLVTVTQKPVNTVVMAPNPLSVEVGQTQAVTASLQASDGTPLSRQVTWTSRNTGLAIVTSTGLTTANVQGVMEGQVYIVAEAEGKSDSTLVTVTPKPVNTVTVSPKPVNIEESQAQAVTAALQALDGTPLSRQVTWTSRNTGVVTVNSTGLTTANVQGVSAGSVYVVAAAEGKSDSTLVTVTPKPVNTVTVSPQPVNIEESQTQALTAALQALDGTPLSRQVTWTSRNPAVANVTSTGLTTANAEGVAIGSAYVIAEAEGKFDSTLVTVMQKSVNTVTVSPKPLNVEQGQTQGVTAALQAIDGTPLSRQVTWTSRDPGVASVTSTGLTTADVQGVLAGSVYVIAEAEGKSDSTLVTVTPPPPLPVDDILIAPGTSLQAADGALVSLSATVMAGGVDDTANRTVVWSVDDLAHASVTTTGNASADIQLASGLGTGTMVTLTVSVQGDPANKQVQVTIEIL